MADSGRFCRVGDAGKSSESVPEERPGETARGACDLADRLFFLSSSNAAPASFEGDIERVGIETGVGEPSFLCISCAVGGTERGETAEDNAPAVGMGEVMLLDCWRVSSCRLVAGR